MENGVSCLCLTYGRPHLLEEAIESFLRQDWNGRKELIIVNDHQTQTLSCHADNVRVFNIEGRLRTLGEKRNLSVALASYDNLLVWDDDDIYLPWRITETMKVLPEFQFFKCPNAWVYTKDRLEGPKHNLFHGGCAYTRWLFEKIGGYSAINGGEDLDLENAIREFQVEEKKVFWKNTILPEDRLYYIYRWGHGSYHTTGVKNLNEINPVVVKGKIDLVPHWNMDYCEAVQSMLKSTTNSF